MSKSVSAGKNDHVMRWCHKRQGRHYYISSLIWAFLHPGVKVRFEAFVLMLCTSCLEQKSDSDHKWLEKEMEKWHLSATAVFWIHFCLNLVVLRPSLSGCCLVIKKTAKMFCLFKEGTRSCKLFHTAHKCSKGIKWALFWDDFYFLLCVGVGQWLGSIFTFPADFSKHGWFLKGLQG